MKHAAAKQRPARKNAKIEQISSVEAKKKVAKAPTVLPFKKSELKAAKESIVQKVKPKKKVVEAPAAVSKSKLKPAKVIPAVVVSEKIKKKKITAPVSAKQPSVKKENKSAPVSAVPKAKAEKKSPQPKVVVKENKKENKTAKKPVVSEKTVQKSNAQINSSEAVVPAVKISAEVQKIKSAVNIGRINQALKAIEAAQTKAANLGKADRKKLKAAAKKLKIAEQKAETTAAPEKIKPKIVKPIGAAVFRGRKTRYDFQVYPLDFEFENVPGIYVISKRKIDHKKRGHHAFVCIGQTDSISSELKKHAWGKCVKKHEANAVSILPEPSEKKRLKIEEDLKAAHAIACDLTLE